MPETLWIGEVARRAGVAGSTLRYYERRGLIAPEGRDGRGRYYRPEVLVRLRLIDHLQRAGCTLREVGDLLDSGRDWRILARRKQQELRARIDGLQEAQRLIDDALACGCESLEGCSAHRAAASDPACP